MKIVLAQINNRIGDIEYNKELILKQIDKAMDSQTDLLLFPEFAISGAPLFDSVALPNFIDRCYSALEDIASHCKGLTVLIGMPTQSGDDYFSSILSLENGSIGSVFSKAMIDSRLENDYFAGIDSPDYDDESDDDSDSEIPMNIITIGSHRFLVVIGSDLDYLETIEKKLKVDAILSFSNPLYSSEAIEEEFDVLAGASEIFKLPIYRVSNVGGNSAQFINFGGTSVTSAKGDLISSAKMFCEGAVVVDSDKKSIKAVTKGDKSPLDRNRESDNCSALTLALSDFFSGIDKKGCIVNIDESIESSVAAAVAVKALGADKVELISFSSESIVEQTAQNLKVAKFKYIPFDGVTKAIEDVTECKANNIAKSAILSAMATISNALIIGSTSKSDIANGKVGLACSIELLGDLYKSEIAEIAKEIGIVAKAKLSKEEIEQDNILKLMLGENLSILDIVAEKFNVDKVTEIYKMVTTSTLSRNNSAPIVKMSASTFGMDIILPLAAKL